VQTTKENRLWFYSVAILLILAALSFSGVFLAWMDKLRF